jgi:hypothetical protein
MADHRPENRRKSRPVLLIIELVESSILAVVVDVVAEVAVVSVESPNQPFGWLGLFVFSERNQP